MREYFSDRIEAELADSIERYRPRLINCCSRLLQIPSVNGVNDEIDVAKEIAAEAFSLGLHVQFVESNPRRPNVVISTSDTGHTGLLLIGHLDTVPAGNPEHWEHPPFSGKVIDGKIYGRGAIDTKGGIASAIYALAALAEVDRSLAAGRVTLACVPDEESGATGNLGIKVLFAKGLLEGLGAIYAYSGDRIALGHRGVIRYRIQCIGQSAHTGSISWQEHTTGANAVSGMARLLLNLESIDMPYSSLKYFDRFRTVITPGTLISGGTNINIVPDYCEALLDIRTTPEYGLEHVEALLRESIGRVTQSQERIQFRYELLNHVPAALSDESAPIFSVVETVIREVRCITPERIVSGPANEGYLLIEHGIPTVCGLGPSGDNAHAVNEYVDIQGLVDASKIFCVTARRLSHLLLA